MTPGQQKKTPQQRRAEALRENLRRRKAQAKGRDVERQEGRANKAAARRPHDSAGIGEEK